VERRRGGDRGRLSRYSAEIEDVRAGDSVAKAPKAAKEPLSDQEYQELKDFLRLFSSRYIRMEMLASELHPIATLEAIERKSFAKAKEGLRQAVTDIVEMTRPVPLPELMKIDAELRENGVSTLSQVRIRYCRDIARLLRKRAIPTETEYYLARAAIEDLAELDAAQRNILGRMIKGFEESAAAQSR
jgi:hypothetical protein